MKYPELFSPLRLGNKILKNRIVMPGMATMYADADGSVSAQMVSYYGKRARGGAGMIILEYTSIDYPHGLGGANQLQLADPRVIPGFRKILDSVEPHGAVVLAQIHHSGARSVTRPGERAVGPVDTESGVHGLTVDEIAELTGKFARAAVHAKRGGMHGVEIHAGHGYLLNQFLSPATNTRTDSYGGSTENRCRFAREVIRAVRAACGPDFIVSIRLAVLDWQPGGITKEEGIEIAKLIDTEDVTLINLTTGLKFGHTNNSETQDRPDGFRVHLARDIKPLVKHPVAIVGKLRTGEMCNEIIADGIADLVVVGRQFIADPEWPNKLMSGREDDIRVCLNCLDGCYSALSIDSGIRCAINPYVGFESEFDEGSLATVNAPRHVVVVGGGVTGMQAAVTAAERGNRVTLLHADDHLGGALDIAAVAPAKEILLTMPKYYGKRMADLGVDVRLGTEATAESVMALEPGRVVVAAGAKPVVPPIPGIEDGVDAWDVLSGTAAVPAGSRVAIIGGGSVGVDTALFLLERGVTDITMLEMTAVYSRGQEATHRLRDLTELEEADVAMLASVRVTGVTGDGVEYLTADQKSLTVPADIVVTATGQRGQAAALAQELMDREVEVRVVGDAVRPGNIRMNVSAGFFAGYGF
jgi:2,4-dienoyl-CoA reductase-like NADH-dependent reductase (Old Yellow Enzyme family)/NADPH-dependent 2,4-dienoyl-CoA reductase/sulfur reductase-like enzyme